MFEDKHGGGRRNDELFFLFVLDNKMKNKIPHHDSKIFLTPTPILTWEDF
jgi:hypothetical protein